MQHIRPLILAVILICANIVLGQNPTYYNGVGDKTGEELKAQLHEIVKGHTVVDYYDTKYILADSDQDPSNPDNIIEVYTGWSHDAQDYGTGGDYLNREHVWSKSHGQFAEWYPMYSDVHNLKPADATVNISRSNKDFDNGGTPHEEATGCSSTSSTWEVRDETKGDVARIMFYMATRYEGDPGEVDLELVEEINTSPDPLFGRLSTLLEWHNQDPPDIFEKNRNNVIDEHQDNRNPFIDNPTWVNMIWGSEPPPSQFFDNITLSPLYPAADEEVTLSVMISGVTSAADVTLKWGSDESVVNTIEMTYSEDVWTAVIPGQASGERVYLKIEAIENSQTFSSITYSYLVTETILSISEVQGQGSDSPFINQYVRVEGVVTGAFESGYYIQDGTEVRSGIYVYDGGNSVDKGDRVVVKGKVTEYFNLTELTTLTDFDIVETNAPIPEPIILACNDVSEDYESMLVKLQNAECVDADWQNNDNIWVVADESGPLNIKNNSSSPFDPQLGENYDVIGILGYSWGEWRVELRNEEDVQVSNSTPLFSTNADVSVMPNPCSSTMKIQFDSPISGEMQLQISDVAGKVMLKKQISAGEKTTTINVKRWNKGVYFLQLSDASGREWCLKKVVVF